MENQTSQLSTNESCLLLKNGIQLWLNEKQLLKVKEVVETKTRDYLTVLGQLIARSEITGVFTADRMEEYTRRRNGEWKCHTNTWHIRGEKCTCSKPEDVNFLEERERRIANCKLCENGYVKLNNGMGMCSCIRDLDSR